MLRDMLSFARTPCSSALRRCFMNPDTPHLGVTEVLSALPSAEVPVESDTLVMPIQSIKS